MFIAHLEELQGIYQNEEGIHIGAAAILTDLMDHELIPDVFKDMIGLMASPPTRNMATIAGNICNASPAGDTLPYLYAVNAKLRLQRADSTRTVAIQDFITGVKKTCLQKDELLVDIIIPALRYDMNVYNKLGQRKGMSLTKASFLGMAIVSKGMIEDIRIALGSVAPFIVRSAEIENRMIAKSVDEVKGNINDIIEQYSKLITPIDDARSTAVYRKKVSLRLIKRFLEELK